MIEEIILMNRQKYSIKRMNIENADSLTTLRTAQHAVDGEVLPEIERRCHGMMEARGGGAWWRAGGGGYDRCCGIPSGFSKELPSWSSLGLLPTMLEQAFGPKSGMLGVAAHRHCKCLGFVTFCIRFRNRKILSFAEEAMEHL